MLHKLQFRTVLPLMIMHVINNTTVKCFKTATKIFKTTKQMRKEEDLKILLHKLDDLPFQINAYHPVVSQFEVVKLQDQGQ